MNKLNACPICNANANYIFSKEVLKKHHVDYFQCEHCKLVFTQKPFWLDEAYNEAINAADTGLVQRNIMCSWFADKLIKFAFRKNMKYLDFAGGYGMFVRMMRDKGCDFYWKDAYCKNLLAQHFEYQAITTTHFYELITAFEVFEHLENPNAELEAMLEQSKNILISTAIYPKDKTQLENWWYLGTDHGQHIAFYAKETFAYLAQKHNLTYVSDGSNYHIFISNDTPKLLLKKLKIKALFFLIKIKNRLGFGFDFTYAMKDSIVVSGLKK